MVGLLVVGLVSPVEAADVLLDAASGAGVLGVEGVLVDVDPLQHRWVDADGAYEPSGVRAIVVRICEIEAGEGVVIDGSRVGA